MVQELIRMEGISKEFPGVKALQNVSFQLNAGEVHALVGENGAGKSTLMKVLTGVYTKDTGSIFLRGSPVEIDDVRKSQLLGIAMIHQEFNLMNHLTVAQNIFIGREEKRAGIFINDAQLNRRARDLFDRLNVDINPTVRVGSLTVAKQQMVEIAKALSYNSDALIMDEPTAPLTDKEIEDLFRVIRMLRSEGKGIIYISHRLEELKQISDRITVMRDGGYVGTVATEDATVKQIISMMVGREIFITRSERQVPDGAKIALEVRNINRGRMVRGVSFSVRKGEILGIAGLVGAGRTETARAIFGADRRTTGEIFVNGKKADIRTPEDAVRNGIAYLSEDRKRYGLMLGMSVETNVSIATMRKFLAGGFFLSDRREARHARDMAESLSIKTPTVKQLVRFLSGGNQQKVVLAKWLTRNCDILIFDEPTRGIDVGAKSEIYKLLDQLAASGKAIIMISSELPEIIRVSNRVIVMCEGRITGEIAGDGIDQTTIMQYATIREA
ncbi:MAG: sugar ABC transporter ATP-binding protein [Eubacteriales bacterium]|nr:sugar ABC transporter ATP-binding protein [Christensenellaceae bacterium]MEA5066042.1 sugar ABC transporter ATP-binding protein [Eubacteriales bacterium]